MRSTIGFEAFIRPAGGDHPIPPERFFQQLHEEDQAFVDRLCRELHLSNFQNSAADREFISLNISPATLEEHVERFDDLKNQIRDWKDAGLEPWRIMVEIDVTPSLDAGIIYTFASQLRELGLGVTLENFDIDCASFSRVLHNRPHVVKFNRSWLQGDLSNAGYIAMVSGVVKSLHTQRVKTHLERIENKQETRFAIACGFNRMQGFHFAKPTPILSRPHFVLRG